MLKQIDYTREKRLYLVELSFLQELHMERFLRGEPVGQKELKELIQDIFMQIDGVGNMSNDLRRMVETFNKLKSQIINRKCVVCGGIIVGRRRTYCSKECWDNRQIHFDRCKSETALRREKQQEEQPSRRRAYQHDYYVKHREKYEERARSYRAAHYEEILVRSREKSRAYASAHREEIKEKARTYRELHSEEVKAKARAYYNEHREEHKARSRAYYYANKLKRKTTNISENGMRAKNDECGD